MLQPIATSEGEDVSHLTFSEESFRTRVPSYEYLDDSAPLYNEQTTLVKKHSSYTDVTLEGIHEDAEEDSKLVNPKDDLIVEGEVKPHASVAASIVNLGNTILGAGLLSIPLGIKHSGLGLGIALVLLLSFAATLTLQYLVFCCQKLNRASGYKQTAEAAFPQFPWISQVIDLAIVLKTIGVTSAYLIIIGDLAPPLVSQLTGSLSAELQDILAHRRLWITAALLILAPLALRRSLRSLRHTSTVALVSIAFLVGVVITHCIVDIAGGQWAGGERTDPEGASVGPLELVRIGSDIFQALPIFVFAFTCHQNAFQIHNELVDPTPSRINTVLFAAMANCAIVYLSIGVSGYLTFGNSVDSNVLKNYSDTADISIARFGVLLVTLFSFPLMSHPARFCLDNVLFPTRTHCTLAFDTHARVRYMCETVFFIACPYALAMSGVSLSTVFGLTGAVVSTNITYILPCVFYLRLCPGVWFDRQHLTALALLSFGLLVLIISPVIIIKNAINGTSSGH
eukprot:GCRY01004837.1.p1 GENE.GCRY01004837.1~~GCRY01004837.1.p1  ORF type:complete len:511 (-),score=121.43 GCRY01004837.1:377-1909(-)